MIPIGIIYTYAGFSAQPRADGDEASVMARLGLRFLFVSVLNREPMGMKRKAAPKADILLLMFQCSTASRWG